MKAKDHPAFKPELTTEHQARILAERLAEYHNRKRGNA